MSKQQLDCVHRIVIEVKTSVDLMHHPVMQRLMDDMVVQLESLSDGSYEDQDEFELEGLNTEAELISAELTSQDTTQYLHDDTAATIHTELTHLYERAQADTKALGNMSDIEMVQELIHLRGMQSPLVLKAQAEIEMYKMLREDSDEQGNDPEDEG